MGLTEREKNSGGLRGGKNFGEYFLSRGKWQTLAGKDRPRSKSQNLEMSKQMGGGGELSREFLRIFRSGRCSCDWCEVTVSGLLSYTRRIGIVYQGPTEKN